MTRRQLEQNVLQMVHNSVHNWKNKSYNVEYVLIQKEHFIILSDHVEKFKTAEIYAYKLFPCICSQPFFCITSSCTIILQLQ